MTILIRYLDKKVSEEKSIYNSIFTIDNTYTKYNIFINIFCSSWTMNAFNEFAICYPSHKTLQGATLKIAKQTIYIFKNQNITQLSERGLP